MINYNFDSFIISISNFRKWSKVGTLMSVTEAVHDVAFAPNVGR